VQWWTQKHSVQDYFDEAELYCTPIQRHVLYPKETRTSISADVDQEGLALKLVVADLTALTAAGFVSNGHLVVHDL
jgi:hypothetical protein